MAIIKIKNLEFQYSSNDDTLFNIPELTIEKGSKLLIEGPSGSGKTTFLNLIAGLLIAKKGSIKVLNTEIDQLKSTEMDQFRANHYGIIFQLFNLIPHLSVLENIALPCMFSKLKKNNVLKKTSTINAHINELCNELDISKRLINKPVKQLSIGEQQRVAIARALIGEPEIIIADEASSALDEKRKNQFMDLLFRTTEKYNATLIFVSHDKTLRTSFNQHYKLNSKEAKMELNYAIT